MSGWIATAEYREKMRQKNLGEGNPNYRHWWPEERRQALSQKLIETGIRKGALNGRAQKVMCVETGEVFDCISLALQKYGIRDHSNMSAALSVPTRTAGGLHWVAGAMIEKLATRDVRQIYLRQNRKRAYNCITFQNIETGDTLFGYREVAEAVHARVSDVKKAFSHGDTYTYNNQTYVKCNTQQSLQVVTPAENLE